MRTWSLTFIISVSLAAALSARASALPIFAHRYGFSCQQCHTTVPNLNAFGKYFLRHGFRLPGGARGTLPIAVKTEITYNSSGTGDTDEPGGAPQPLPKLLVDEIEVLSAGSIGRNTSYYLEQYVVDDGLPGQPRDMWVELRQVRSRRRPDRPHVPRQVRPVHAAAAGRSGNAAADALRLFAVQPSRREQRVQLLQSGDRLGSLVHRRPARLRSALRHARSLHARERHSRSRVWTSWRRRRRRSATTSPRTSIAIRASKTSRRSSITFTGKPTAWATKKASSARSASFKPATIRARTGSATVRCRRADSCRPGGSSTAVSRSTAATTTSTIHSTCARIRIRSTSSIRPVDRARLTFEGTYSAKQYQLGARPALRLLRDVTS